MFPYLLTDIVIVEGKSASGIYNLKLGSFFRVTKEAGKFLLELNGTRSLKDFSLKEQQFIEKSVKNKIIGMSKDYTYIKHKNLEDILTSIRKPKFAWLELTSKCNQKCLHCFMGKDLNTYGHFDIDKIYSIIDDLYKLGIKQLVLTGGEASLHSNFLKILDYISKYNFEITLLSNGTTKALRKSIPYLREYGIKTKISILGWESSHDTMAGLSGAFDTLLETIDLFVSQKTHVELGMTVCSVNYMDIAKVRTYANNKKIKLELSPIFPIGLAINNLDLLYQHSQKVFIQACQEDKINAGKSFIKFTKSKREVVKTLPTDYDIIDLRNNLTCTYECGSKILAILASGKISPCLLLRNDDFVFGDLYKNRLSEIYLKGIAPSFISKMDIRNNKDCSNCEALFASKGRGCVASTFAFYNDINHRNPYFSKCYYKGDSNER